MSRAGLKDLKEIVIFAISLVLAKGEGKKFKNIAILKSTADAIFERSFRGF